MRATKIVKLVARWLLHDRPRRVRLLVETDDPRHEHLDRDPGRSPVRKLHALAWCVGLPRPQRWLGGPMGQQLARSGVNLNALAFQSAMNACKALAPAAKAAVGPTFGQSKAMMVGFARCMRAHGLKTFPDPTVSSVSRASQAPQPSGADMSYSGPGGSVTLDIPQSLIQSPAFNMDSAACGMETPSGQKQKPPAQS
jgi:hypothetical protein